MTEATHTLTAPGLRATFVPGLAMLGCSLEHDGDELLVQRDGVAAYRERGATMGIPLLHPWANRLAGPLPATEIVRRDPNGLPIHGAMPAALPFRVLAADATQIVAEFDTHDHPEVLEIYRHPHTLTVAATISGDELEIRTTMRAHGRRPAPVAFGYHPYLHLPGVPREEWTIDIPARTRLVVDERMLPTGAREPVRFEPAPLGNRAFDDSFTDLGSRPRFVVAGGARTLTVEFVEGYDHAQVYAPAGSDLICFEPMTAPTNALATGTGLTWLQPGDSFSAVFRITVSHAR